MFAASAVALLHLIVGGITSLNEVSVLFVKPHSIRFMTLRDWTAISKDDPKKGVAPVGRCKFGNYLCFIREPIIYRYLDSNFLRKHSVGNPSHNFPNIILLQNWENDQGIVLADMQGHIDIQSFPVNKASRCFFDDCRQSSKICDLEFNESAAVYSVSHVNQFTHSKNEYIWPFDISERALGYSRRFLCGSCGTNRSMGSSPCFNYSAAHEDSLCNEGRQLQQKDTERNYADNNLVRRILNKFVVVRRLDLRLYLLFFGFGLLFGGGYNIYRERFFWGAALIGIGSLFGFSSLVSGGLSSLPSP